MKGLASSSPLLASVTSVNPMLFFFQGEMGEDQRDLAARWRHSRVLPDEDLSLQPGPQLGGRGEKPVLLFA